MRLIRSVSALVVLVAVVAGAPWLLWQVGRQVLPDRIPSLSELWDILTSRDTGTTFVTLLVVVGVIAWAVFTICVLLEIVARVGGRQFAWRIPGLRVPQHLASGLISTVIAGVVVLGGQTAATAAPTSGPVAPAPAVHQVMQLPQSQAPAPHGVGQKPSPAQGKQHQPRPHTSTAAPTVGRLPTVTVQDGDSLWRIAERHLGDPLRYTEIADLNIHTGVLTSAEQWLEPGWVLRLPADATGTGQAQTATGRTVVVEEGDTLTGIAQRELGSADRYLEIAELNRIANPDVIDVGQKLRLPVAEVTGSVSAPPVQVAPSAQAAKEKVAEEAKERAVEKTAAERAAQQAAMKAQEKAVAEDKERAAHEAAAVKKQEQARAQQAKDKVAEERAAQEAVARKAAAAASASVDAARKAIDSGDSAPAPTVGQSQVEASAASDDSSAMKTIGIGAVAASVLWGALLLRRRRQGRRRKLGEQPVPASLPAARVERQMRQQASAADVERLEQVLRTISVLASDDQVLPDVTCAWLSSEGLHLQLAAEAPPVGPFEVVGHDWWLPAETELPDVEWTEAVAPWPALASIGAVDGESVLVDLEQLGAVRVSGNPQRVQHLYNHLAVELAHSTWSDGLQVTLVGWGEDLVALAPDRVDHEAGLDAVVTRLRHRVARTRESEQSLDTTVLGGRIGDIAGEIWSPQVLLIAPVATQDPDQVGDLDRVLEEMAEQGRATVAVVAAVGDGDLPTAVDLSIDDAGELSCPAVLGDQRIRAAGVDEDLLDRLVELITGVEEQQAAPPAADPEPWAQGMAASGALLEEPVAPAPAELDRNQGEEVPAGGGDVDDQDEQHEAAPGAEAETAEPDPVEQQAPASAVVPLRSVSPAVAAMLESVLSQDPTLDADLDEWNSLEITRPRIAMLGTPEVRASGKTAGRLVRCTEIAIYMALYRSRTTDQFETDLWADGQQPSAGTRRWWLSTVRTWLGSDDADRPYLAQARRGVQELTDRLLDLDLLRRLRKRGEAWAAAGDSPLAYRDLRSALRLVRGPILDQAPAGAYAFLANPDRGEDQHAPLWVVQIAHQAVDLALQLDDLDGAREAAEVAHRVAPHEDTPLTDLVRVAQSAGRQMEAQQWAKAVLREHAAEYIEDIENTETMLLLSELFPRGLRLA